jgi:SAM-dependent methyltransferase
MKDAAIARGAYARKQIFSRSRLIAWSHGSRFSLAARLVEPFAGGRLLDYGCGDGTFAAMVHDRFAHVVGTDADANHLADCAARFGDVQNVCFVPQGRIDLDAAHAAAYDVVTCMEVLEHCVDDTRAAVIAQLRRLVSREGRVIVSLPIETGLSLPAKQAARRLAAWRGIGDYAHGERYTWREMLRMTWAGETTTLARPTYESAAPQPGTVDRYHGHKGFNWRVVARELAETFELTDRRCTPMPPLGTLLNSQVWLICRPRAAQAARRFSTEHTGRSLSSP